MKDNRSFLKGKRRVSFILAIITALLVFTVALAAGEVLDPNFGTNGVVTTSLAGINDSTNHVVLQADGKILISGVYQTSTPFIARYNSNGTLDPSFGANGILRPTISGFAGSRIAIQSNGKVLVAGSINNSLAVARYNSAGTALDATFGTQGIATISDSTGFSRFNLSDLVIQPDQKIIVVGTETNTGNFTNIVVARFNTNGTPDDTFVAHGFIILDKTNFPNNRANNGRAVVVQTDGKIVISGDMMDDDGNGQISLARLIADGSLDTAAFGTNGKGTVLTPLSNFVNSSGALALQTDGRIIVAGTIFNTANEDLAVARFNSDGSLDTTFGGDGIVQTDFGNNENTADVVMQPNGKIIVVGKIYSPSFSDILLIRYNSDGTLDNTFGDSGKIIKDLGNTTDLGNGIVIQPNGMLVVAGSRNGTAILARYIVDVASHPTTSVTFKATAPHDGWILESGENTNSGGSLDKSATTLNVGDDAKDKQYRSIVSFNTASLPDNAIVTSAHLDLKRQGVVGTDPFTTHGDLLLDIKSGTFSNDLALQVGDFNAAGTPGAVQDRIIPLTSTSYTSQLNSANLGFINKTGITQFRLLFATDDNDDLGADYVKFFSGDGADANVPKLVITYFVP